jgi:hypothetical protein
MDYVLKYELWCKTKITRVLYKAKVYFDGYVGSQIDHDVPISSFRLRKDKAAIVRGTSFEFSIRETIDFEFLEFYTNNAKKIKVELYDPSNNLAWVGYNLPQQYQVPYIPAPTNINFIATDGLGLLKNEPFAQTGRNSQLDIIRYCIDKIGLSLNYSIAINLFETTHDHAYTPLAQTYEDSEIYSGKNCYEVLENILGKYDAEITQCRGFWAITCSVDKKSTRMIYTSAGVYSTTEISPVLLNLGYPGAGIEVSPKDILQMGLEPGGKQVKILQDYGRKDSLLLNYDFSSFASNDFENWTRNGTVTLLHPKKDGVPYAVICGHDNAGSNIEQIINVVNVTGQNFVFEIDYAAWGYNNSDITPIEMQVDICIYITNGYYTYYLSPLNSGWGTEINLIENLIQSSIALPADWQHFKIITNELPISGNLHVILRKFQHTPDGSKTWSGVAFSRPLIYYLNAAQLYPASLSVLAEFSNSTEPIILPDINILSADVPDLANNSLLYLKATWLASGAVTTAWHRLGSAVMHTLVEQLALTLASNNKVARQKLTGYIKGTGISFDSIIKHAYNSNREFEIAEGIWDIYDENFNVILLELLPWTDETVIFTLIESETPL